MAVNVAINRAPFLNETVCESHQVWAVLPQGTAWSGQGSKVSLLGQNKGFSSQVPTHCCPCPRHLGDVHADARQLHAMKGHPPCPITQCTHTPQEMYLHMLQSLTGVPLPAHGEPPESTSPAAPGLSAAAGCSLWQCCCRSHGYRCTRAWQPAEAPGLPPRCSPPTPLCHPAPWPPGESAQWLLEGG